VSRNGTAPFSPSSPSPSPVVGLIHFPHSWGADRVKLLRLARSENRSKGRNIEVHEPRSRRSRLFAEPRSMRCDWRTGSRDDSDQYPSVAVSELHSEPPANKISLRTRIARHWCEFVSQL